MFVDMGDYYFYPGCFPDGVHCLESNHTILDLREGFKRDTIPALKKLVSGTSLYVDVLIVELPGHMAVKGRAYGGAKLVFALLCILLGE